MTAPGEKRSSLTRTPFPASEAVHNPQADVERVVIVVGPEPDCAETVAQGFATQGEAMRVMWFSQACQALASGVQKALAGVIVCHRAEQKPEPELDLLRHAWPETPILAWPLG